MAFLVVLVCGMRPAAAWADRYVDRGNGTAKDTATGLVWQKVSDGVSRSWSDASAYCDSLTLGGRSDWRLPRVDELSTIVDYDRYGPARDPIFKGPPGYYWSATDFAGSIGGSWIILFRNGYVRNGSNRSTPYDVRCVRGGPFWSSDTSNHLEVHSDNTIKDTYGGYIWERHNPGNYSWGQAQQYCADLVLDGISDWRAPAIDELQTIIDYTQYRPAMSSELFFGLPTYYWSSSTYTGAPLGGWVVQFESGSVRNLGKHTAHRLRCVSGGPSGSLSKLLVFRSGDGSGHVTSSPGGIDCGEDCSELYATGTQITLTALPAEGSEFAGWSGGQCSGTGTCTVTVQSRVLVTASFNKNLHAISGRVRVANGGGLPNVTITLTGAANGSTLTVAKGLYAIKDLPDGLYTVTPSRKGYRFSPES